MAENETEELREKLAQLERRISALDYVLHRTNQVLSRNLPGHLDALMDVLERDIRLFSEEQSANPIADEIQGIIDGLDHLGLLSEVDKDQSV